MVVILTIVLLPSTWPQHVPIAGADPSDRGVRQPFEVELPRQRRHDANPRPARQIADLGRDDRRHVRRRRSGAANSPSSLIAPRPSSVKLGRRFLQQLPAAVEQPHRELLLLARPQQHSHGTTCTWAGFSSVLTGASSAAAGRSACCRAALLLSSKQYSAPVVRM